MKVMCETEEEYFLQQLVHQKLQGHNMPHPKCKATILIELASELRHLKEEYSSQPGKIWKKKQNWRDFPVFSSVRNFDYRKSCSSLGTF